MFTKATLEVKVNCLEARVVNIPSAFFLIKIKWLLVGKRTYCSKHFDYSQMVVYKSTIRNKKRYIHLTVAAKFQCRSGRSRMQNAPLKAI